MKFLDPDMMIRAAVLNAVAAGKDKHGDERGEFSVESPDGLSKLTCHCYRLASITFYLYRRDKTSDDFFPNGDVDEQFANGFLRALNIPVKE